MNININGMLNSILIFLAALFLVDFVFFLRAWSMNMISMKRTFKNILKINALTILSVLLYVFFDNFTLLFTLFK